MTNIDSPRVLGDLGSVRDRTTSMDGQVPCLLLPLRIEARFMKVDAPQAPSGDRSLADAIDHAGDVVLGFLGHEALTPSELEERAERLSVATRDIAGLGNVTRQQKGWLQDLASTIGTLMDVAVENADDSAQQPTRLRLDQERRRLAVELDSVRVVAEPAFEPAHELIEALDRIIRKLRVIRHGKAPYSNPRRKRQLYHYIETTVDEVHDVYRSGDAQVAAVRRIKNNQFTRVEELQAELATLATELPRSIRRIHRDDDWQRFCGRIETAMAEWLPEAVRHLAEELLPKLQFISDIKHVGADMLHYTSVRTLIDVARANADPASDDSRSVRSTRARLRRKVAKLEQMTSHVVDGPEADLASIRRTWNKLNESLDEYRDNLRASRPSNSSREFGIRASLAYLDGKAVPSIGALVESAADPRGALPARVLRESQAVFHGSNRSLEHLDAIVGQLTPDSAPMASPAIEDELDRLDARLRVVGSRRLPIAESQLRGTGDRLSDLRATIDRSDAPDRDRMLERLMRFEERLGASSIVVSPADTTPRPGPIAVSEETHQLDELWVRVFPDDIHVQTHEPPLTASEISDGQLFWHSWWAASQDEDLELGAWRLLAAGHGSTRAGWIARALDPRSLAANEVAFSQRPSSGFLRLTATFADAAAALSDVDSGMGAAEAVDVADATMLRAVLESTATELEAVEFEQVALLQMAVGEARRLESSLAVVESVVRNDPLGVRPDQADQLADLSTAFDAYARVQQRLVAIEPLDTAPFLARFDDLTFPNVEVKGADWTVAPHAATLPERCVVVTITGDEVDTVTVGEPIPRPLNVGFDPATFEFEDEADNPYQLDDKGGLQVEPGMRWMVDFDEAVSSGMGVRIPITAAQAKRGFDRVIVVGLHEANEDASKLLVEQLIENHQYSADGMELLAIGTPTNNTADGPAGRLGPDDDPDSVYRDELGPGLFADGNNDRLTMADGQRLADALGIDPDVLRHVHNSDNREVGRAQAMHRSLWHASVGDYMESAWDHVFPYDTIERTYRFVADHVIGRGSLPSLRVGDQPYGIIPTTAFSRLRFDERFDENNLPPMTQAQSVDPAAESLRQLRYDILLKRLLSIGRNFWEYLSISKVKHAYNLPIDADGGDTETLPTPQQHFIEMLGLEASAERHFFRYGVNIANRGPQSDDIGFSASFRDEDPFGPRVVLSMFAALMQDARFFGSFDFPDELNPNLADPEDQQTRVANRINHQFRSSRIFEARLLDAHTQISGPAVDGTPLSDVNPVERNIAVDDGPEISYISWLVDHADDLYEVLGRNDFATLPSNSMLFLLMRQSLLLSYREAALGVMEDEGFFSESYRRLIGSSDRYRLYHSGLEKFVYTSKWTFLFRNLNTFNNLSGIDFSTLDGGAPNPLFGHLNGGNGSLANFLLNKDGRFTSYPGRPRLQQYRDRIDEIRSAMRALDDVPTRHLKQLLDEHMDVTSHRLDAWLLGMANRRLEQGRRQGPSRGIHLGAYGWLEDLRPGGTRDEALDLPPALEPPDGAPVFTDDDNEGFIHAPSLNQAISAAVLRSGYTASRDRIVDLDNRMAVNLSSRRVRRGMSLLEGVSSGQSLGEVLGFQFERGLHEGYAIAELDRFIYRFRERFPLVVPVEVTPSEAADNPHGDVVDGLQLLQQIETHIDEMSGVGADESIFEVLTANGFVNTPGFIASIVDTNLQPGDDRAVILTALIREIDKIGDALDALADLTTSESVYQIVQGNHVRAAAVVEALATGRPPAEIQFIDTPRTGVVVTHRVLLHFPLVPTGAAQSPPGWPATLTVRALAEPSLNRWLGHAFGPGDQILCLLHGVDPDTDPVEMTMADLGIQPIDLLMLLGIGEEQGAGELQARVERHAHTNHDLDDDAALRVSFTERLESWGLAEKTVYEVTLLARQLGAVLAGAKYIDALDHVIQDDQPELDNPEGLGVDDLRQRVTTLDQSLRDHARQASEFISQGLTGPPNAGINTAQRDTIDGFLFAFADYGFAGSVVAPVVDPADPTGHDLVARLREVVASAETRLAAAEPDLAKLDAATRPVQQVDALIAIGRHLLGRSMVLLPGYEPGNRNEVIEQLDDDRLLRHRGDADVMGDWIQDLGNVRPGLYAFDLGCMLSEALGATVPTYQAVQFPYSSDDFWLGVEYPADQFAPEGDYLSVVLADAETLTGAGDTKVGIIVDEWTEIIPSREEVTGVAFQYDAPDAQAPQNLLLAVNPDVGDTWRWDDLVHTIDETLDLAKIRAVEPDHIEESVLAQVLPMVIGEVVPPQLRAEIDEDDDDGNEKPFQNPLGTQVVMDFVDNLPKKTE